MAINNLQSTVGSRSRGMKSFVFEPDRGVVMQENNVWDNLFEFWGHLGHLGTPQESPKGLQVAICGVFGHLASEHLSLC